MINHSPTLTWSKLFCYVVYAAQTSDKLGLIRFIMVGLSVSGYAPFKPSLFCVNKAQESFAIACPLSRSYISQIDILKARVGAWGSISIAERFIRDTSLICPFS